MDTADVIIVGAGAAGLAAARRLTEAGKRIAILEARDRAGGRIHTCFDKSGHAIELGAEFIHGIPSISFDLVKQAGLQVEEVLGDIWTTSNGELVQAGFPEDFFEIFSAAEQYAGNDISFAEFTAQHFADRADSVWFANRYVEGFDAAKPALVSLHWLLQTEAALAEIDGERDFRVIGGYSQFPQTLINALAPDRAQIHYNAVVKKIQWQAGNVQITAETPSGQQIFTAPKALVTLPLGVLKHSSAVEFDPPLLEKEKAMKMLEMGSIVKLMLIFKERFWDSGMTFLFSPSTEIVTWWAQAPSDSPVLTAWIAGDKSAEFTALSKPEMTNRALRALAGIFKRELGELNDLLEESFMHNWNNDPFAHGVYSYVKSGGMSAPAQLAQPIESTLYFAGEATDTQGFTGTVHGAMMTGERAAREILDE